jgi:hypothetical protein
MTRASTPLIAAATLVSALAATPAHASEALRNLDGRWRGPDYEILIDVERLLVNTDPAKPFGREPLVVKNIAGSWVTFSVGAQTFFALVEEDTLQLVRPGRDGTRMLARVP